MTKINEDSLLEDCNNKSLTQLQVCQKHKISLTRLKTFLRRKELKWVIKPDPKKRYFSKEDIKYLIEEHNKGKSLVNLGLEFNCVDTVIGRILRENGIETKLEKKHRDVLEIMERNKDKIIDLYTIDKISGNDIAKLYPVSNAVIYRYLAKWGIKIADKNKRMDVRENKDKIIEMYNERYALSEICEIFKCDHNCIIKCLKEWGIDTSQKRVGVGTYIENKVEKFLIESNIAYQKQFKLERSKFDFYIPSANLFIETHGDYWHGNPKMYKELDDIQKFKKNLDRKKRKIAKIYGYNYIWIWGEEIKNRFNNVKKKILTGIKKFTKTSLTQPS